MPIKDISIEYFNKLNPRKIDGKYNEYSLIRRIEKKREFHRASGDLTKEKFYSIFLKKNNKILYKLLTSKPKRLRLFQRSFEKLIDDNVIPELYQTIGSKTESTEFGKEVLEVFGYTNLRDNSTGIWLATELGIRACPYCNLENAYNVDDYIFYQLDHFIPKVIAPYLSVSFYNLIPSCGICNTQGKGTKLYNISSNINPYSSDFNRLSMITINVAELKLNDKAKLKVNFERRPPNKFESKVENYINDFKLEKRYRRDTNHDEAMRLISISEKYPDTMKRELMAFNKGLTKYISTHDLKSHILKDYDIPYSEAVASRNVIGKFKFDLAKQLEIL
jgi:hypothetical protein